MTITNHTKHTTVAKDATFVKSNKDKTIGLIGAKMPKAIVFETRFGIHTLGVRFPIDVLILDEYHKIVALKKNLKPNWLFSWNPKYKTVIELPNGTIEKTKTKIGDTLHLE